MSTPNLKQRKIVYVAHPYGSDKQNALSSKKIVAMLSVSYPEYTFVSPIATFGFMYKMVDYEHGMDLCLSLLSRCDALLLTGDWQESRGCKMEENYAIINKIPTLYNEFDPAKLNWK